MSRYVLVFAFFAAVALASIVDAASDSNSDSNSASTEENPDCPKNEKWSICGKICEPSCCIPKPQICPAIACTEMTAACRCKRNFVRNDKQQCVKLEQCNQICPRE